MKGQGKSRLAGYGKRGPIYVNPNVPVKYRGIDMKRRLLRHEVVERRLRQKLGLSYREAHRLALKAEHEGLTKRQICIYEGKLGSIARWGQ
jgi:hypothetical protein